MSAAKPTVIPTTGPGVETDATKAAIRLLVTAAEQVDAAQKTGKIGRGSATLLIAVLAPHGHRGRRGGPPGGSPGAAAAVDPVGSAGDREGPGGRPSTAAPNERGGHVSRMMEFRRALMEENDRKWRKWREEAYEADRARTPEERTIDAIALAKTQIDRLAREEERRSDAIDLPEMPADEDPP